MLSGFLSMLVFAALTSTGTPAPHPDGPALRKPDEARRESAVGLSADDATTEAAAAPDVASLDAEVPVPALQATRSFSGPSGRASVPRSDDAARLVTADRTRRDVERERTAQIAHSRTAAEAEET